MLAGCTRQVFKNSWQVLSQTYAVSSQMQRICKMWQDSNSTANISTSVVQKHLCDSTSVFGVTSFAKYSSSIESKSKEVDKLFRAIDILVKGHEEAVLQSFADFCLHAANELDITVNEVLHPKFIVDRITALKSKHIYKKHKVQYEMRTHRKVVQIKYVTGTTADVFLEYIQRNLPSGVALHIHKWELARIPNHIKDEIKNNLPKLTSEDWERESENLHLCSSDRDLKASDYEEYPTTRRYLIGTSS